MKHLERNLKGDWQPRSGTIYPALKKLEKEKLIHSRLDLKSRGPIRKTYFLTYKGKKTVDELLKNTKKVQKTFEEIASI
jgi:DNA-binding PadR family transcriptional regulator